MVDQQGMGWRVTTILRFVLIVLASASRQSEEAAPAASYYRVLGVPRHASASAIRKAYYRRAVVLHPDKRCQRRRRCDRSRVNAEFSRATEAYEVLRDERRRAEHDAQLAMVEDPIVGAFMDWVASSPTVVSSLWSTARTAARRSWQRTREMGGPGAAKALLHVASKARHAWLEDRVGVLFPQPRLASLVSPALVAVYSSAVGPSRDHEDYALAFARLCARVPEFDCFALDCSLLRRNPLCAKLAALTESDAGWKRVYRRVRRRPSTARPLAVLGDYAVELDGEADAVNALMAASPVSDLRRIDSLRAFLKTPAHRHVVLLADDYDPSRRLAAVAIRFASDNILFAEARAKNTRLAATLGRTPEFPTLLVVAPDGVSLAAFDEYADLEDWLADDVENRPTINASSTGPSRDDLEAMRASELRRLLFDKGLTCMGCVEKADFVARLLEDAGEPSVVTPTPNNWGDRVANFVSNFASGHAIQH